MDAQQVKGHILRVRGADFLALQKREYKNGETIITAENMNAIQDEVIAQGEELETLKSQVSTLLSASVEEEA